MSDESVIYYVIGIPIMIFVGKWLFSWYAEIGKRNKYMEAQIKMTAWLCIKQGVDPGKVADALLSTIPYASDTQQQEEKKQAIVKAFEAMNEVTVD